MKIGTAPDAWGVWFPSHEKQTPWNRCMDEMQKAGYEGVELGPWGYFPTEYNQLHTELKQRNLKLVAATVGCDFLDDNSVNEMLIQIDDIANLLLKFEEAKYIVLLPSMYTDLETGEYTMNPDLTDDKWNKYTSNVQKAANYIATKKLVGLFHPHADCHVETEEEIERFLNSTTVDLCFDTGHHVYGGGDPVAFYLKHSSRIPYLHIKDCDLTVKKKMQIEKWSFAKAVIEDIMIEPGKGSIDFVKFNLALKAKNFDGWLVVEQDLFPVKSFDIPFVIAERTRKFLKEVTGY